MASEPKPAGLAEGPARADAAPEHERRRLAFSATAAAHEETSRRLSIASVVTFLAGGVAIATGFGERSVLWFSAGGALALAFVATYVANACASNARDRV